jgi:beta-carotene 3-hydroxylase
MLAFFIGFSLTEVMAYFAHRFMMHGCLWFLHQSHHLGPRHLRQKNDFFAFIFAVPSSFSIIFGSLYSPELMYFGFGIAAYGLVYLCLHDIVIHGRFLKLKTPRVLSYIHWIRKRHMQHHQSIEKESEGPYGLLIL